MLVNTDWSQHAITIKAPPATRTNQEHILHAWGWTLASSYAGVSKKTIVQSGKALALLHNLEVFCKINQNLNLLHHNLKSSINHYLLSVMYLNERGSRFSKTCHGYLHAVWNRINKPQWFFLNHFNAYTLLLYRKNQKVQSIMRNLQGLEEGLHFFFSRVSMKSAKENKTSG